MARLVVSPNFSLRMDLISVADLWDGRVIVSDGDYIRIRNDAASVTDYDGAFLYDFATDELVGGDLFEITHFSGLSVAYTITGLDLDMGRFLDWAEGDLTDLALANIFAGRDQLTGGSGADYLEGFGGSDVLDGRGGADDLIGGFGNDTYYVDNAGDAVIEEVGQGNDRVFTRVSYALTEGSAIEVLSGASASAARSLSLTGNAFANTLVGHDGASRLDGGGGNDRLDGAYGNDWLMGGFGQDQFRFTTQLNSRRNVDTIADFNWLDDLIVLENAIFRGLRAGELRDSAFRVGATATDASDRIIYNKAKGTLSFDADGVGGVGAVRFAKVQPGLDLRAEDFFVI
ncbi:MAG TPA: calcium-binding protein [Microvirga sp.]|jgi:Ca2+-binding RTX toxin-like protein